MNWDRALPSPWMQIFVQKSVDIYNLIHKMELLEHVLNSNTHWYENHYQESEHNCKINMSNMMRGGPISKNNVFIIFLSDPNSWKIAHLLSLIFFFFFLFFSYSCLAIFFFWINKKFINHNVEVGRVCGLNCHKPKSSSIRKPNSPRNIIPSIADL